MSDTLSARVARHLSACLDAPVTVSSLAPISGGACQDNLKVVISVDGGAPRTLVLRSDAPSGLPGSIDRRTEARVITAAVAAGVPTPAARHGTDDLVRPGAHAWFMDWVDGVVLGGKVARSRALADARSRLPAQLGAALAAIHRVPVDTKLPVVGADADPVAFAVEEVAAMVASLPAPRPAQQWAVRWLRENRPPSTGHTLVHRDFRLGNLMVDAEAGLVAVLDWEFARYGDPAEDLGWFCVRDWRFGVVDQGGGGVCTRATLLEAYASASGRHIPIETLLFWEVLGNVRWAASAIHQGARARAGGKDGGGTDVELLAIPRRAAEMEWEALRLIRRLAGRPSPALDEATGPVGDGTPPEALITAAVDWLQGPALQTLSGVDRGVAYQARVVAWLLSGVAREVEAVEPRGAAAEAAGWAGHDALCAQLRAELSVVQPGFDLSDEGPE